MFGFGGVELIVILVLGGGIWLTVDFVRGGPVKRALMRLAEAAVFRESVPPPRAPRSEGRLQFPRALLSAATVSVLGAVLYGRFALSTGSLTTSASPWTRDAWSAQLTPSIVLYALKTTLILALFPTIYLHFKPGHDRRRMSFF